VAYLVEENRTLRAQLRGWRLLLERWRVNERLSCRERGEMSNRPMICPGASARTRQARERDGERYDKKENREYPVDSATRIVGRRSLPKAEEHTPSGYQRQKRIRAWQQHSCNKPRGDRSKRRARRQAD